MEPPPNLRQPTQTSPAVMIAMLAASVAVAGFAISNQSYWIDEAPSLIVGMARNPAEAWHNAQAVGGPAIQVPLYDIYIYAWHKFFGGGEWTMRASNIPLFVFAQLAFLTLLRSRPRLAVTASALALLSPALWMYLDEARPYIMQYAAACWLAAAILRELLPAAPAEEGWKTPELLLLSLATVLLFGSSLIGVLWAAGAAFVLLRLFRNTGNATPGHSPSTIYLAGLALSLLALAAWYMMTRPDADRAEYFRPVMALSALPYIAYEFLGFAGFGPGRLELRVAPVAALGRHFLALLPLAVVVATLALLAFQRLRGNRPERRAIHAFLFAVIVPTLIIIGAMLFFGNRPLPRHFMPMLPFVILGLAALLPPAMSQPSVVFRAAAIMLPLLWLCSSLNLRWRGAHAKDDYRTAARITAAALRENKEVWWAADAATGFIYLTPMAMDNVPGRAWAMQGPQWDDIRFKFPPRVIVMSKPDIFDPHGAIARYAGENHFVPVLKLPAFSILMRENDRLPTVMP